MEWACCFILSLSKDALKGGRQGKRGNERQMEGIGWKEGVKERRRQEPTSKKKEGRLGEGGDGEGRG